VLNVMTDAHALCRYFL